MELNDLLISRIALGISFIGLILIVLLYFFTQPKDYLIKDLGKHNVGENVRIQGKIVSYSFKEKLIVFDLFNLGKLNVVIFNPTQEQIQLIKLKPFVTVTGKIDLFKGEIQLTANEVKLND